MHLPVSRYRQMQRIDLAADHHHPVFARIAVAAAGIEIFDDQQIVSGQAGCRRRQFRGLLDQDKIASGVIAGRTQQQRK